MERLFIYLTNLSSNFAYVLIFGILIACGLGFPLPEDVPLIASGYLVWDGTMEWAPAIVVSMIGVLAGDTLLFLIGKRLGVTVLEGNRFFKAEKVMKAQEFFEKYGQKIVFFARFVAGIRAVVFFLAGAMKMPYLRFILLDSLAALLSVPLWIALGYALGHFFGSEISRVLIEMRQLRTVFTGIVFTIIGVVLLRFFLKYRRAKSSSMNTTP